MMTTDRDRHEGALEALGLAWRIVPNFTLCQLVNFLAGTVTEGSRPLYAVSDAEMFSASIRLVESDITLKEKLAEPK
jgi:hypothetical protein